MGGWVGVWRCDDLEEEEMQFLCTATGVLCFRGEICTGTEREKEGEGEGVSRNDDDGGKYERERKVIEGFNSFGFLLLLLSPSSRLCQLIATYIVCTRLSR